MPKVSWDELNDVIHNVKDTLTKMVGIELMCKKIKKDAVEKMSEVERYCKIVKKEAVKELDRLNEIVLAQVNEKNGEK